jgi:hypothetical protein
MSTEATFSVCNRINRLEILDIAVLLFCMGFIPSAVIQSLLSLDERTAFALSTPLILFLMHATRKFSIHRSIPVIGLFLLLTGACASLFAGSTTQFLMGVTLVIVVVMGRQLFLTLSKPKALRVVTWFTLALLMGGVISIGYVRLGGQPLFDLVVGYRTTHLYLTTFSFAFVGDFIRPSGIFDEPGAFSMYVAIVTMFNDALRQNQKLNLTLVTLVIFTGALAGLAMAVLFLLTSNSMGLRKKRSLVLVGSLVAAYLVLSGLAPTNPIRLAVDAFYSDRLKVQDGRLVGDNRTNQVSDFFRLVDDEILLKGATNSDKLGEAEDISASPFSITFGFGLIISIPYFLLLLWLIAVTIRNRFQNSYATLGLFMLLLQRPYLYHMSWSILIVATVWLIHYSERKRPIRGGAG